ncbi:MAG: MBL fold metallo-hydrolase [Cyclobacteriaceae bacterium]|nr:MBL fold metallo-hydrolase [Cyclobacteriaceae bacterium]
MIIQLLGTGTSQGIPVIACECTVCKSSDPRDKRLRSSVHIQDDGLSLVIDTGPDFRQQVLQANICRLDAVLFTHQHKDHVAGLDDVRSFNFVQSKPMPVYGNQLVLQQLRVEFAYAFAEERYPGVPQIDLIEINGDVIKIGKHEIIPIKVMHHKLPVFGYRLGDFVYITDAKTIPDSEIDKARNAKVLVINALQKENHVSHFTLAEALEMIEELKPEKAYLTHLGHKMGLHHDLEKELPDGVFAGYDFLTLEI